MLPYVKCKHQKALKTLKTDEENVLEKISYHGKELLPIKSDIVFKIVFGKPENIDILAKLLEALLDIEINNHDDITLTNTELSANFDGDKLSRFDVRVRLADTTEVEIEIQLQNKYDMIPRSIYYEAILFSEQLREGKRYIDLPRTITLNILDFSLLDNDRFINRYQYMNIVDNTVLSDLCEINFLELKKVPTEWYNDKVMWALFIATNDEKVIDMLARENQDIKKAVEILEYVSSDRNERFRIDQIDKARRDHLAENAANREEGFKEGIEVGIEREKLAIAKNLIDILDNETISKKTGLTIEQVQALR